MIRGTYKKKQYADAVSTCGCTDCAFGKNDYRDCAEIQRALGFCGLDKHKNYIVFKEIPKVEKQKKPNIFRRIFWYIFAVLYFPIYFIAIILIKICAFIAAICYALLHEPTTAKRLLNSLLNKREYGEY